ncbi:hypothetical protein KP509_17G020400 [Ceratopteris richardii]|uniref:Uncharacterized protein n=1 Tax=Ceratopteris richardii TaxID=49495 RepID=A0A8T2SSM5_CERRI|nr:hypothetical protein KP509_17G020400 [Ceratopteris richardii]
MPKVNVLVHQQACHDIDKLECLNSMAKWASYSVVRTLGSFTSKLKSSSLVLSLSLYIYIYIYIYIYKDNTCYHYSFLFSSTSELEFKEGNHNLESLAAGNRHMQFHEFN